VAAGRTARDDGTSPPLPLSPLPPLSSYPPLVASCVRREGAAFLETATGDPAAARMTMREYLDAYHYGPAFRNYYLIPEIAAVWSASAADVLDFPAATFIQFCVNHSLLQV